MLPIAPRPRRILMTCDAVGGVWRYSVDLARSLGEVGVEVLLVGLGPEPGDEQRAEAAALPRASLRWLDGPLDWMTNSPEALLTLPARLLGLAKRNAVDLLHLNLPSQAAGLRRSGMPMVVVSHSSLGTWWRALRQGPVPAEWEWIEQLTRDGLAAAGLVVAPSGSHARALREVYGTRVRPQVVPNAASPWAQESAPVQKEPMVLAAGRWWDEGKNLGLLEEAAGQVEWPVVLAGALVGPNGASVSTRATTALGERPAGEVRALMAKAAIFVSPSLYEPFGLAVLEAAQSGSVLVLSDIPTYRELWEGCAAFVPPRQPAALADTLNRLSASGDERRRLGAAARARAADFTPQRQRDGFLALYGEALGASLVG